MDDLVIILMTYNRLELAKRTVIGLRDNLIYEDGNIHWIICDDSSDNHEDYVASLQALMPSKAFIVNGERKGVGYMVNRALAFAHNITPLTLIMEDDWELRSEFNITPYARIFFSIPVGYVRFGYLSPGAGGHLYSINGQIYFSFEDKSFTYNAAGHPHLTHKRYYDYYGYYPEGVSPGETELQRCAQFNAKNDGPAIVYPINIAPNGVFPHIGSESLNTVEPVI